MADVGVRDYLGQLVGADNVGYDEKTKGVTATVGGKTYNLGNEGMTLGDDGRYYVQNGDMLKNLLVNKTGYQPLRNTVQSQGGSVGWANNQPIINGQAYNSDGMINTGNTLYADPNFLKGLNNQYQDPYQGKQDKIFNKLYSSSFNYNPNTDNSLRAAQKQAQNSVTRDTARRGILNSTDATYYSGLATSQLVPQYEQMAYGRYQDENQKLMNLSNMLSNMSSQDIQAWQANNTQTYNNTMMTLQQEQQAQQKQQMAIESAYKKVETLGYADNETAIIIGVPPGTPAASVRQTALDKANQIELMKTQTDEQLRAAQAQYEMESTIGMDIYKRQTEIGTQAAIDQYQATIGAKGSGKKGSGDSGGSGGYVATAIQEYAANHGLGSYLNMSAEEIANVINSVVADEEQRKQYYTQYGIAANDTPSVNPQNTPIQTSEYRFAVEGKPKVEPIFKIYTPTPQKKISTEGKPKVEPIFKIYTPTPQKKISTEEKTDVKSSNKIKTYGGNTFLD